MGRSVGAVSIPVLLLLTTIIPGCDSDSTGPGRNGPVQEWSYDVSPSFDLWGIAGQEDGGILAGGRYGTLVRFAGGDWDHLRSLGPEAHIRGMWAFSDSDIFAASDSHEVYHFDGNQWSVAASAPNKLNAVWGSSLDDVYAVGYQGALLHSDGNAWVQLPDLECNNFDVWGTGPDDVWVVGGICWYGGASGGGVYHFDGVDWTPSQLGSQDILHGVWASGPHDVFVVGRMGTILHYDGADWASMEGQEERSSWFLWDVWGSGPDNVFAVGYPGILHYDGSSWTEMESGTDETLFQVWGRSGTDVYAVGEGGVVLHFDGTSWETLKEGRASWPRAVWGASRSRLFAVGSNGLVLEGGEDGWTEVESGIEGHLQGVFGFSGNEVFAVGTHTYRYDGQSWRLVADRGGEGIWGSSPDKLFMVSAGEIFRLNGSEWGKDFSTEWSWGLNDIWGSSGRNIVAVGNWEILQYDGDAWRQVYYSPERGFNGVWGSSKDDIFAVGSQIGPLQGVIFRYDGESWSEMDSGARADLLDVWGSSPADVYAVGRDCTVLHYDGSYWTDRSPEDCSVTLSSVWLDDNSDVIVIGEYGTILRGHR